VGQGLPKESEYIIMTEQRYYYFGYGMNTNNSGMASRCPTAINLGAAVLPGYRFVFRGHADVELDLEGEVHGVLWEIGEGDLASLDRLEGFPKYYLRQRAWVDTPEGVCQAWVYMMNDQDFISKPYEGYYQMCYEGYRENEVDVTQLIEAREAAFQLTTREEDYLLTDINSHATPDYIPFDTNYREMF
jgi:gamma-glutamylcyclotransferase (GGCT)/AIG2-like uncharacterized protein YtfP